MFVKVFSNSALLEAQRNNFPYYVHLYTIPLISRMSRQVERGVWLCCFEPGIYEHTQSPSLTDSSSLVLRMELVCFPVGV